MKTVVYIFIFFLLTVGEACTRSKLDPSLDENTHAVLNDRLWSGQATFWWPQTQYDSCAVNTFNVEIQSSLPYPKGARLCANCQDQSLSFTRIPVGVGTYTVSKYQPCSINSKVGVSYTTLIGGDVVRDHYFPHPTNPGTITISKYDSLAGEVEGTFDITLERDTTIKSESDAAETVLFRKGIFTVKLPQ